MWRSWRLGTAFGIGIYVHWSFLFVPLYVILTNWSTGGLALVPFLLLLVLGVFGCVVLHELGHALMARQFGIATRDITLYPIGGVARLERMSEKPPEELLIALAGPAVNVVLAMVLFLVVGTLLDLGVLKNSVLLPDRPEHFAGLNLLGSLLGTLMLSNLVLAGFNLLPAFPMDGGRVLRALLSLSLDRLRATEIASSIGVVLAVGLGITAVFFQHPMLLFLSGFVVLAGQQELAVLRRNEARRRMAVPEEILDVLPAEEPQSRFTGFIWDGQARVWVVWRDGRPVATFGATSE